LLGFFEVGQDFDDAAKVYIFTFKNNW